MGDVTSSQTVTVDAGATVGAAGLNGDGGAPAATVDANVGWRVGDGKETDFRLTGGLEASGNTRQGGHVTPNVGVRVENTSGLSAGLKGGVALGSQGIQPQVTGEVGYALDKKGDLSLILNGGYRGGGTTTTPGQHVDDVTYTSRVDGREVNLPGYDGPAKTTDKSGFFTGVGFRYRF